MTKQRRLKPLPLCLWTIRQEMVRISSGNLFGIVVKCNFVPDHQCESTNWAVYHSTFYHSTLRYLDNFIPFVALFATELLNQRAEERMIQSILVFLYEY